MHELTGKLAYMVGFTAKGNPIITLEINEREDALKMVDALHDEKLSIKVCKHDKKRSLNANSYYWLLIGKLSKAMNISTSYCHNLMLRRYGELERIDDQVVYWVIPDTEEATRKAEEAETFHIKPTSNVREGNDGIMYRTYLLLKGSHEYTRSEFTKLVNGLVDECHNCGIETKSQEEIDSLLAQYGEERRCMSQL